LFNRFGEKDIIDEIDLGPISLQSVIGKISRIENMASYKRFKQ
jgi:hypothetical protein